VNVEAAERGQGEHLGAEEFAEGGDDNEIGLPRSQLIHCFAHLVGLNDRPAELEGGGFHRARGELFAATGGFIGLGDDAHNGKEVGGGAEAGHGEFGRAHEDDAGLGHGSDFSIPICYLRR